MIHSGSTAAEREEVTADVMAKTGARLVPAYDHPDVMLGQGTVALEMEGQVRRLIEERDRRAGGEKRVENGQKKEEKHEHKNDEIHDEKNDESSPSTKPPSKSPHHGRLDALLVPCGGGGLLSGCATALASTGVAVFGAEPSFSGADDARRSLATGTRITAVRSLTIADGLRTPLGVVPWSVVRDPARVRGIYAVGEDRIRQAMRLCMQRLKVVVEPSAVVGLAAALWDEEWRSLVEKEGGERGWDVGIVLSGGNVELDMLEELLGSKR